MLRCRPFKVIARKLSDVIAKRIVLILGAKLEKSRSHAIRQDSQIH